MSYIKKRIKVKLSTAVYSMASYISPVLNTQLRFIWLTGRLGNLKKPQTFSEKLSWLKLNAYDRDPLVKQCADKYKVREYVTACGYEKYLNPLYSVYRSTDEIDWECLPDSFVLKWNYGCGFNILCPDKTKMKWADTKKQLDKWKKDPFWPKYSEMQYKTDEKYILCERYMESDHEYGLLDYKFYCFHGKVMAVLVISRVDIDGNKAILMTPQWEILSDIPTRYKESIIPDKPSALNEMITVAETLSQPFPFVRVDFYEYKGQPVFGEMTFTPAGGILPSQADIDGKDMGRYINLERYEVNRK